MLLPVEREIVLGTGYKEPLTLLEDLMAQLYPIEIVLRLLTLISLANQVIYSSLFCCKCTHRGWGNSTCFIHEWQNGLLFK
jgi:hypothetical protein